MRNGWALAAIGLVVAAFLPARYAIERAIGALGEALRPWQVPLMACGFAAWFVGMLWHSRFLERKQEREHYRVTRKIVVPKRNLVLERIRLGAAIFVGAMFLLSVVAGLRY